MLEFDLLFVVFDFVLLRLSSRCPEVGLGLSYFVSLRSPGVFSRWLALCRLSTSIVRGARRSVCRNCFLVAAAVRKRISID